MVDQQPNKKNLSESDDLMRDEMEIDLMDIFRKVVSIRKTLYKAALIGLVIGIIVALSIPKQYTVTVTLSPEMGNSKGNNGLAGLAASFLGSGATVGDDSDALNASLSSDIVSSTPFLLELFNINVLASDKVDYRTLKSYLDTQSSSWWSYAICLPGVVIKEIKSLFFDGEDVINNISPGTIELTKEDNEKIIFLRKSISAIMDKKTAITNVSVKLQNPKVAAIVADSVVHKLQEYIIDYRTSKAKEDCVYLEKLFKERQNEYYAIQKKYATYVDTHDNLILQSVRTEQERLQNDMSLAYQVYSQVANQLQVARAKVQEEKPVFVVVEPAVVPLQPSSMARKVYMILFMFLAVFITIIWKLWLKNILSKLKQEIV